MKKIVKKNYKILIGIIIGIIISTTIVYSAENILTGSDVTYSNGSSSSDNVQRAIDELYEKANSCNCKMYIENDNPNPNIMDIYKYDQKHNSSKCITGSEITCKKTTCYENKAKGVCPPGTIINYKVNTSGVRYRFYVLHDDGETMTLQSSENISSSVSWNDKNNAKEGPTTALAELERKTSDWNNVNILWNNVNTLSYSIGDSNSTLGYSGCKADGNCNANVYNLSKNNVKARMITFQEASFLGCSTNTDNSCPIWLYNNLSDNSAAYWTLNTYSETDTWYINNNGRLGAYNSNTKYGIRPVVEINK